MKRFLWIPLLFLVCCSTNTKNYNSKLVNVYENVHYYVYIDSGNVAINTSDGSKEWLINDNTITFVYERAYNDKITNYFFEYTNYYRLLVFIRHLGD